MRPSGGCRGAVGKAIKRQRVPTCWRRLWAAEVANCFVAMRGLVERTAAAQGDTRCCAAMPELRVVGDGRARRPSTDANSGSTAPRQVLNKIPQLLSAVDHAHAAHHTTTLARSETVRAPQQGRDNPFLPASAAVAALAGDLAFRD